MGNTVDSTPSFVVEKTTPYNGRLHFVRRTSDGEQFLAKEFEAHSFPELLHLREPKPDAKVVAYEAAARILNHENLISIVSPMCTAPVRPLASGGVNNDFSLVYEFCADGNLKQLFDRPPMEVTAQGFLPEGLVWHVALSMLRALTFLHEGWREKIVVRKEDGVMVRSWYRLDDDWMPILHHSIRPENIHFQARKGKETYGLCKLGNFGRCIVAGTARDPAVEAQQVLATVNNLAERDVSQDTVRRFWKLRDSYGRHSREEWIDTQDFGRVYTTGSELADVGGILYRMMKGGHRIEVDICRCGCFHMEPDPKSPCRCSCPFEDVVLTDTLLDTKYSSGLRDVVVNLIGLNRSNEDRAYEAYEQAWGLYRVWKLKTAEGRVHFDHYDDLVERKRAEKRRKLEERGRELGDEALAELELAAQEKDEDLIVWN